MQNCILEENLKIRYSEVDCDNVLKPQILLQYMEALASDNAEMLGFGYTFVKEKNLAWFLLKYRMEFTNYPENISELTVRTEPRGYNKLFAYRDFEIINEGKIIGKAATVWALADINTRAMVNVSEILKDCPYMNLFEKRNGDLVYTKIKEPEYVNTRKYYDVRFDDLDVNRHVNNSNYISWGFDTLDFDFRRKYKPKAIDMIFKKEAVYGERILAQTEIVDKTTTHILKNMQNNELLCLIKADWTEKTNGI